MGIDRATGAEQRVGLRAVTLEHHLTALLYEQRQRPAVWRVVGEQHVGSGTGSVEQVGHGMTVSHTGWQT